MSDFDASLDLRKRISDNQNQLDQAGTGSALTAAAVSAHRMHFGRWIAVAGALALAVLLLKVQVDLLFGRVPVAMTNDEILTASDLATWAISAGVAWLLVAPFIASERTTDRAAPWYYLLVAAVATYLALGWLVEGVHERLGAKAHESAPTVAAFAALGPTKGSELGQAMADPVASAYAGLLLNDPDAAAQAKRVLEQTKASAERKALADLREQHRKTLETLQGARPELGPKAPSGRSAAEVRAQMESVFKSYEQGLVEAESSWTASGEKAIRDAFASRFGGLELVPGVTLESLAEALPRTRSTQLQQLGNDWRALSAAGAFSPSQLARLIPDASKTALNVFGLELSRAELLTSDLPSLSDRVKTHVRGELQSLLGDPKKVSPRKVSKSLVAVPILLALCAILNAMMFASIVVLLLANKLSRRALIVAPIVSGLTLFLVTDGRIPMGFEASIAELGEGSALIVQKAMSLHYVYIDLASKFL